MFSLTLKHLIGLLWQFFCHGGLIYQLVVTSRIYLQNDTVTKIEYHDLVSKGSPSIVVCLPRFFPKTAIDEFEIKYLANNTKRENFDRFFLQNNFLYCNDFEMCDVNKILSESLHYLVDLHY